MESSKSKIIAYCGLDCGKCDAYIATQHNDIELKEKLAKKASEQFGREVTIDELDCDGCSNTGAHIDYWAKCEIRKCAVTKMVDNCALCDDYACDKLNKFMEMVSEAKENLEKIRNKQEL